MKAIQRSLVLFARVVILLVSVSRSLSDSGHSHTSRDRVMADLAFAAAIAARVLLGASFFLPGVLTRSIRGLSVEFSQHFTPTNI